MINSSPNKVKNKCQYRRRATLYDIAKVSRIFCSEYLGFHEIFQLQQLLMKMVDCGRMYISTRVIRFGETRTRCFCRIMHPAIMASPISKTPGNPCTRPTAQLKTITNNICNFFQSNIVNNWTLTYSA